MLIAFSVCVIFLAYVYGGFSLLVAVAGTIRNRKVAAAPITPRVSLIVAAYNEEDHIAARIENALAQDYPPDRIEIIIASDGSTDSTNRIVEPYPVLLLKLPRRGKLNALNAAASRATGDILVFSDANSLYEPEAIRKLVRNFADPEAGGVAGRTCYRLKRGSDSASKGESLYWSFDNWLKRMESRTGSIVSAHGGIYAIRRELFQTSGASAATDDFAISTAVIQQGYRLVYEPEARSFEYAAPAAEREFRRKVRLMTRGLAGVLLRRRLLNPFRYGFYSIVLLSHKLLRRLVPFFLIALLATSLFLPPLASVPQLAFYTLAGAGYLLRRRRVGHLKLFYIPFFYCMANAAAFVAVLNVIRGRRIEFWQPQRDQEPEAPA